MTTNPLGLSLPASVSRLLASPWLPIGLLGAAGVTALLFPVMMVAAVHAGLPGELLMPLTAGLSAAGAVTLVVGLSWPNGGRVVPGALAVGAILLLLAVFHVVAEDGEARAGDSPNAQIIRQLQP